MKVQLILALATVVLSVMADTKRSFNITKAMAKPAQFQPVRKPAYLRTTPEERRKLSVFPKNTLKFVATTKAPPKKIDNEMRRKHSVLLPKMAKQVQATLVDTNTEAPFKSTMMYNFKPTRAPKIERFSNKPRYATTVPTVPLKTHTYKKDLYKRKENEEFLSKKINLPATLPKKNIYNEESSQEDELSMVVRKDLNVFKQDKNKYDNAEQEVVSQEEIEDDISKEILDNISNEEGSFSQEVEEDEQLESRENDQSIEIEAQPTMMNAKVVNKNLIEERSMTNTEVTAEKIVPRQSNILPQSNELKEEEKEMKDEVEEQSSVADEDQFMLVRDKRNNQAQVVISDDIEVNTEPLDEESYYIKKRSIVEEENIAPTVAGIKYTGKESTLSDNSNFRNIYT